MVMIDVWNFCWLQMFMLACLKNLLQSFYTVKAGICISVLQYFINLCFAWSFKTLFSKRNREKARGKKEEKEKIYSTLERGCEWINLRDRRSEKKGKETWVRDRARGRRGVSRAVGICFSFSFPCKRLPRRLWMNLFCSSLP